MISVQDVSKRFGGLLAVDHCSLEVARGSITGLIGPNGAGKSTLFNIIAGLLKPDSGKVLLEGEDVTAMPPHRLFHRGLVRTFQIPHELSQMTVLENLTLVPAGQSGETVWNVWFQRGRIREEERINRERALEVLDLLNLRRLRHELAGNLSGGQKKLLELGRTMMTEPRVLLLDEPGAGVNRTLLGELSAAIQRLNREKGLTIFIIEHDMDFIAELCDPIIVMTQGSVLTRGTMAEIRRDERVLTAYFGGAAVGAEA